MQLKKLRDTFTKGYLARISVKSQIFNIYDFQTQQFQRNINFTGSCFNIGKPLICLTIEY